MADDSKVGPEVGESSQGGHRQAQELGVGQTQSGGVLDTQWTRPRKQGLGLLGPLANLPPASSSHLRQAQLWDFWVFL